MTAVAVTEQRLELQQRLDDAKAERDSAERALGAVVLDGGDEQAASQRLDDARAAIDRLERALTEHDEREARRRQHEHEQNEAVARWRVYMWWADYLARIPDVIRLRAELEAAEQEVIALGSLYAAVGRSIPEADRWLIDEATAGRLDLEALNALPETAIVSGDHDRFQHRQRAQEYGFTSTAAAEWLARVQELASGVADAIDPERLADVQLPWPREEVTG